jgi:uncharacterized protein (DUF952 family)
MTIILHITPRNAWEASCTSGYYKPSSLNLEGFIHCSTVEQTVETANQYFANQQDLVLLCIDVNKIEAELKYEAPAGVHDQRTRSLFPHLYGPLNVSAVVRVVKFVPRMDGKFVLPERIVKLKTDLWEIDHGRNSNS